MRVQSRCYRRGVTIHLPERKPRAPTHRSTHGTAWPHYLRSRENGAEADGSGEEERKRGGDTENASATARILTRVARGPNSVTMRAARGIPRNTLNTSSSQKTNDTTRPIRALVCAHTSVYIHTHTYTLTLFSSPDSLIL